jgi:hypothetical protein
MKCTRRPCDEWCLQMRLGPGATVKGFTTQLQEGSTRENRKRRRETEDGQSDQDFDALFITDKPIIFAFHGYAWRIHRLTYRRTDRKNRHVRGYKEERTTTTPFDMCVLNDVDRLRPVEDVIDRLPLAGGNGGRRDRPARAGILPNGITSSRSPGRRRRPSRRRLVHGRQSGQIYGRSFPGHDVSASGHPFDAKEAPLELNGRQCCCSGPKDVK